MNLDIPIGDLDNWRQVYTDNFTDDVALGDFPADVAAKWRAYPSPWKDSSRHGVYSPGTVVSIADGVLTKHVHTANGVHLVAAIAPSVPGSTGFGQLYGRYAICWRSDSLPGYKVAWLLWPDSSNRAEGEIDWPEMNLDAAQVGGFVHRIDGQPQSWVFAPIDTDQWNVSVMEWSPGLVVLLHNGVEVFRSGDGIPDRPMHWVIQTETELSPAPPPADDVSGDVQILWVAAWQWDTSARAPSAPRQITLNAPATATGVIPLGLDASPDVTEAKWVVAGREVGYSKIRPFSHPFDSREFANGVHLIYAKGRDATKWFDGPKRTIRVSNAWALVAPAAASGTVRLAITPQLPWLIQVKWVVNGREIGSDQTAPFEMMWDSRRVSNGVHTIYCKIASEFGWVDGQQQRIVVAN